MTNNQQLNLSSLFLNQINGKATIGIKLPGLVWDSQRNLTTYHFSIRVTDDNGNGISSYIPVSINVIDINNHAPIPMVIVLHNNIFEIFILFYSIHLGI